MALEAEVRAKLQGKLDAMQKEQQLVQSWIEEVTGSPFDAPFAEALKSGVRLCELMNRITPGAVKRINQSKLAFKQMENIGNFIQGCKALGLAAGQLFDTIDLYEEKDVGRVIECLVSLGAKVNQICEEIGYTGPRLETSIKFASANKREFTEEQLTKQRAMAAEGTAINKGSAGVMERAGVLKTGITFGNDNAGSGSTGAVAALSKGSAEVMERHQVLRQGITFGNSSAGSGSAAEVSTLNKGSAGVMERAPVQKHGITVGADAAGASAASSELGMLGAGSANVMERLPVSKQGITFGSDSSEKPSGSS